MAENLTVSNLVVEGSVGIRTTDPKWTLQTAGRIGFLEGNRYWSIGAGRSDGTGYGPENDDGTTDTTGTFAIRDQWENRDRLRIDYRGNVGIGTTGPVGRLTVKMAGRGWNDGLVIEKSDTQNRWQFSFDEDDRLLLGYNNGVRVSFFGDTGNVGIGTPSPWAKLDVRDGDILLVGADNATLSVRAKAGENGRKGLIDLWSTFENYPDDVGPRRTAAIEGGYNGGVWGTEYLGFRVGGSDDAGRLPAEKFRIQADGNVGIGMTNPDAKLVVDANGTTPLRIFGIDQEIFRVGEPSPNEGDVRLYHGGDKRIEIRASGDTWFNGGNVGIGTTSPGARLSIYGESSDSTQRALVVANSIGNTLFSVRNDGRVHAARDAFYTGSLAITGAMEPEGSRVGLYEHTCNNFPLVVFDEDDGTCRLGNNSLVIDLDSHVVSIGLPEQIDQALAELPRLDVEGQVRIRGGNPGAGKVLTSDSAGIASWEDPQVAAGKDPRWTDEMYGIYCANQNVRILRDPEAQWDQTAEELPRLEVDGQIKMTGGEPGAGKVLTSDPSGVASWEDPQSLGFKDPRWEADQDWRDPGIYCTQRVGIGSCAEQEEGQLFVDGLIRTTSDIKLNGNVEFQGGFGITCRENDESRAKIVTREDGLTFQLHAGKTPTATGNIAAFFDSESNRKIYVTHSGDMHLEGGDIILEGADCAEYFRVEDPDQIEPGTVLVVDCEERLQESTRAYDKRVIGVVSGAGDLHPGILLGNSDLDRTRVPVALTGKVYCRVDARHAPIEIGDLLTTSSTPGHAMKAEDPLKAFGAVIGKALHPVKEGQALVPIMVTLH